MPSAAGLFGRTWPELLPFLAYWRVKRLLDKRRDGDGILTRKEYKCYSGLRVDQLRARVESELGRGDDLDDKTFRLSFALSFGLAVFGIAGGITIEGSIRASVPVIWAAIGCGSLAAAYLWTAAVLAAGALESIPSYGESSEDLLQDKMEEATEVSARYAGNLAKQEIVNLNRHNRNNATYMCLRNALIWLALLGALVLGTFVYQRV